MFLCLVRISGKVKYVKDYEYHVSKVVNRHETQCNVKPGVFIVTFIHRESYLI